MLKKDREFLGYLENNMSFGVLEKKALLNRLSELPITYENPNQKNNINYISNESPYENMYAAIDMQFKIYEDHEEIDQLYIPAHTRIEESISNWQYEKYPDDESDLNKHLGFYMDNNLLYPKVKEFAESRAANLHNLVDNILIPGLQEKFPSLHIDVEEKYDGIILSGDMFKNLVAINYDQSYNNAIIAELGYHLGRSLDRWNFVEGHGKLFLESDTPALGTYSADIPKTIDILGSYLSDNTLGNHVIISNSQEALGFLEDYDLETYTPMSDSKSSTLLAPIVHSSLDLSASAMYKNRTIRSMSYNDIDIINKMQESNNIVLVLDKEEVEKKIKSTTPSNIVKTKNGRTTGENLYGYLKDNDLLSVEADNDGNIYMRADGRFSGSLASSHFKNLHNWNREPDAQDQLLVLKDATIEMKIPAGSHDMNDAKIFLRNGSDNTIHEFVQLETPSIVLSQKPVRVDDIERIAERAPVSAKDPIRISSDATRKEQILGTVYERLSNILPEIEFQKVNNTDNGYCNMLKTADDSLFVSITSNPGRRVGETLNIFNRTDNGKIAIMNIPAADLDRAVDLIVGKCDNTKGAQSVEMIDLMHYLHLNNLTQRSGDSFIDMHEESLVGISGRMVCPPNRTGEREIVDLKDATITYHEKFSIPISYTINNPGEEPRTFMPEDTSPTIELDMKKYASSKDLPASVNDINAFLKESDDAVLSKYFGPAEKIEKRFSPYYGYKSFSKRYRYEFLDEDELTYGNLKKYMKQWDDGTPSLDVRYYVPDKKKPDTYNTTYIPAETLSDFPGDTPLDNSNPDHAFIDIFHLYEQLMHLTSRLATRYKEALGSLADNMNREGKNVSVVSNKDDMYVVTPRGTHVRLNPDMNIYTPTSREFKESKLYLQLEFDKNRAQELGVKKMNILLDPNTISSRDIIHMINIYDGDDSERILMKYSDYSKLLDEKYDTFLPEIADDADLNSKHIIDYSTEKTKVKFSGVLYKIGFHEIYETREFNEESMIRRKHRGFPMIYPESNSSSLDCLFIEVQKSDLVELERASEELANSNKNFTKDELRKLIRSSLIDTKGENDEFGRQIFAFNKPVSGTVNNMKFNDAKLIMISSDNSSPDLCLEWNDDGEKSKYWISSNMDNLKIDMARLDKETHILTPAPTSLPENHFRNIAENSLDSYGTVILGSPYETLKTLTDFAGKQYDNYKYAAFSHPDEYKEAFAESLSACYDKIDPVLTRIKKELEKKFPEKFFIKVTAENPALSYLTDIENRMKISLSVLKSIDNKDVEADVGAEPSEVLKKDSVYFCVQPSISITSLNRQETRHIPLAFDQETLDKILLPVTVGAVGKIYGKKSDMVLMDAIELEDMLEKGNVLAPVKGDYGEEASFLHDDEFRSTVPVNAVIFSDLKNKHITQIEDATLKVLTHTEENIIDGQPCNSESSHFFLMHQNEYATSLGRNSDKIWVDTKSLEHEIDAANHRGAWSDVLVVNDIDENIEMDSIIPRYDKEKNAKWRSIPDCIRIHNMSKKMFEEEFDKTTFLDMIQSSRELSSTDMNAPVYVSFDRKYAPMEFYIYDQDTDTFSADIDKQIRADLMDLVDNNSHIKTNLTMSEVRKSLSLPRLPYVLNRDSEALEEDEEVLNMLSHKYPVSSCLPNLLIDLKNLSQSDIYIDNEAIRKDIEENQDSLMRVNKIFEDFPNEKGNLPIIPIHELGYVKSWLDQEKQLDVAADELDLKGMKLETMKDLRRLFEPNTWEYLTDKIKSCCEYEILMHGEGFDFSEEQLRTNMLSIISNNQVSWPHREEPNRKFAEKMCHAIEVNCQKIGDNELETPVPQKIRAILHSLLGSLDRHKQYIIGMRDTNESPYEIDRINAFIHENEKKYSSINKAVYLNGNTDDHFMSLPFPNEGSISNHDIQLLQDIEKRTNSYSTNALLDANDIERTGQTFTHKPMTLMKVDNNNVHVLFMNPYQVANYYEDVNTLPDTRGFIVPLGDKTVPNLMKLLDDARNDIIKNNDSIRESALVLGAKWISSSLENGIGKSRSMNKPIRGRL